MAKPKVKTPEIVTEADLTKIAKKKGNVTFAQHLVAEMKRTYQDSGLEAAWKRAYSYLLSWTEQKRPKVPALMEAIKV